MHEHDTPNDPADTVRTVDLGLPTQAFLRGVTTGRTLHDSIATHLRNEGAQWRADREALTRWFWFTAGQACVTDDCGDYPAEYCHGLSTALPLPFDREDPDEDLVRLLAPDWDDEDREDVAGLDELDARPRGDERADDDYEHLRAYRWVLRVGDYRWTMKKRGTVAEQWHRADGQPATDTNVLDDAWDLTGVALSGYDYETGEALPWADDPLAALDHLAAYQAGEDCP